MILFIYFIFSFYQHNLPVQQLLNYQFSITNISVKDTDIGNFVGQENQIHPVTNSMVWMEMLGREQILLDRLELEQLGNGVVPNLIC